jgi:hypothetical protein
MYDQFFEAYRRASESWLQIHQDVFKTGMSQMLSSTPGAAGAASDLNRDLQQRWLELVVEILNRHRESLDTTYKSIIHMLEQTRRMADARTPDEYRRVVEDMWRKWFDSVKSQSETQFRDVQNWAGRSLELVHTSQA